MIRKKILIVFGTRPEAIKMAPLVQALRQQSKQFSTLVCVTAQHRQMLDQVLHLFDIVPDYDLNLMKPGQDLYDITSGVLTGMREVLNSCRPDWVLVHGDTSTSMAAALAAFYQQIPVAHIEAGLRTYNALSPWPEEINRQITTRIAQQHFAPTIQAKQNLINEHVDADRISVTGNTVIDAMKLALFKIDSDANLLISTKQEIQQQLDIPLQELEKSRYILVTGHRRENFGEGFTQICEALKEVAIRNPGVRIIYPVHLNPNVQKPVNDLLKNIPNIHLLPPLTYLPFLYLMRNSYAVLTDSGGIQEEAPGLGKPVLVMRDTTERPEAIKAGTVKLVGTVKEQITRGMQILLDNEAEYKKMSAAHNPYGNGEACQKIVEFFLSQSNN